MKQIYLLFGEEGYLKRQYRDRLTRAMLPEGDTMNYACYEGKGIEIREVIDLAETMPFFAERRLIVFENSGFSKAAEQIWRIISRSCRRPPASFSWKMKWTSGANCIRQ